MLLKPDQRRQPNAVPHTPPFWFFFSFFLKSAPILKQIKQKYSKPTHTPDVRFLSVKHVVCTATAAVPKKAAHS